MVGFDCLAVGVIVTYYGLREGDANVLDCHLVVLIGGGNAPQMCTQVLESFVVVFGQLMEEFLDGEQTCVVGLDATGLNEICVQIGGGERVGQLVEKAFEKGDYRVWIVPVVVAHIHV